MNMSEKTTHEARQRIERSDNLLPDGNAGAIGLAGAMDWQSIQSMMDDFFKLTNIGIAILDLDGKILVATGWQDICTKFHRIHPETCRNCLESDIHLSNGVEPGTFRLYRCKNNMWDIATPITVDGKCMGNLFLGQFLFSDESPDTARAGFPRSAWKYPSGAGSTDRYGRFASGAGWHRQHSEIGRAHV